MSDEWISTVMEAVPTAMVMVDREGRIARVNSEAERLFGYSPGELRGQILEKLIPFRFRRDHSVHRNSFLAKPEKRRKEVGRDLFGLHRDGTEFPVEVSLNPIETEEGMFTLAVVVDITERIRQERMFRMAVEAAPTALMMVDERGEIILANSETERLFGYSREELVGELVEVLIPLRFREKHVGHRDGFFKNFQTRLTGEGRDLFGLRKDGTEIPVEVGLNYVETQGGMFALAAVVDISRRKQLEENLRQSNKLLAESNDELRQFAYVASHDLQTPLRTVAGFAQCLKEDHEGKLDEETDDYIRRIVKGCERMKTLINDLLTYSRVESRSRPFTEANLNELFDEVVELLGSAIEESQGAVTRGELPTVEGDPTQLLQVLQNLVGNSLKYHGDTPPRVHAKAVKKGADWIISIKDNGIGIAPRQHERIFEVFGRLHTQEAYPGTGIGLAVCRRIILRHGGRIWFDSEEGHGSTFHFTIPEHQILCQNS